MNSLKGNFPLLCSTVSVPGELIGVDYLYRQTGKAMQDVDPDSEETDQMLEDVGSEEDLEDEGFGDAGLDLTLDPTVEVLDLPSDMSPVLPTPTSSPAALTAGPLAAPPTMSPAISVVLQQQPVSIFVTSCAVSFILLSYRVNYVYCTLFPCLVFQLDDQDTSWAINSHHQLSFRPSCPHHPYIHYLRCCSYCSLWIKASSNTAATTGKSICHMYEKVSVILSFCLYCFDVCFVTFYRLHMSTAPHSLAHHQLSPPVLPLPFHTSSPPSSQQLPPLLQLLVPPRHLS